ncbi:TPA: hypothetical protein ACRR2I_002791 [Providencia rettgeri]
MLNNIEKIIFDRVKKNATLKNIIVKLYQRIFSIIGLTKKKFITDLNYHVIENGFFGFHDRPSMNYDNKVLNHIIDSSGNAKISLYDLINKTDYLICTTSCCNNQQGSLLTWFDNETIIFNDFQNIPITRIINTKNKIEKKLPFHFYSISSNKKMLTSINFLRFGKGLPGYGYDIDYPECFQQDSQYNISKSEVSDFCIYTLNSLSSEPILFKSFKITELKKQSQYLDDDGYFYFSHSAFSPNSDKVYFLLRSSNKKFNTSQLFVYDILSDNLKSLPTGGMVSHLTWLGNDSIVAYCNIHNNRPDAYYRFNLNEENYNIQTITVNKNERDGHPHAIDLHNFITDTYPDRERRQHLYTVNTLDGSVKELLSLYSPLKFRGNDRVDLHPRLSLCGKYITIDSSHNNKKQQIILEIKD